jgi:hypothetical protein
VFLLLLITTRLLWLDFNPHLPTSKSNNDRISLSSLLNPWMIEIILESSSGRRRGLFYFIFLGIKYLSKRCSLGFVHSVWLKKGKKRRKREMKRRKGLNGFCDLEGGSLREQGACCSEGCIPKNLFID